MKNKTAHRIGEYVYFMANNKVRKGKIYDYCGDEYYIEVKIKGDGELLIRDHIVESHLCFATLKELFDYLKTTQRMLLNEN